MNPTSFNNTDKYCVFRSGTRVYAIRAVDINQVSIFPTVSRVPMSDPILLGASQIQKEFVSVFSLKALVEMQYEDLESHSAKLLVLGGNRGLWGLAVDEVMTLANLELSITAYTQSDDGWSNVVQGSASFRDQIIQVLDADLVYQYAKNLMNKYWDVDSREKYSVEKIGI